MKNIILLTALFLAIFSKTYALENGKYAIIDTTKGEIVIKLEYQKTPLTVINFAGLALGQKDNKIKNGKPFYDGLKFHRVIDNFMAQGGDPKGNGTGGPGYKFIDEITDLKHDRAGTLSMANSGANTNGSQFFITHKNTDWLDGKHTVFGYVVKGMENVNKIKTSDIIKSIKIKDVGEKAKKFTTTEADFQRVLKDLTVNKYKKANEKLAKFVKENTKNAKNTKKIDNYFVSVKKSSGKDKPKAGDLVKFDLGIYLASGTTIQKKKEVQLAAGRGRLTPILENELMDLSVGDEVEIFVPYYAIYGDKKVSKIKSDEIIIFNLELKKIN
jgi:peptidyl-prolyl cis-trans isomerase A (cyclophilin A)